MAEVKPSADRQDMPSIRPKKQAALCEQNNCVLTLVDIQTQATGAMPMKVLARLQRNIGLLVQVAATLQIPVLVTEQESEKMGQTEAILSSLLPHTTKIYNKMFFSCAGAEDFLHDLATSKRRQIILSGMEAHISVLQTAMELQEEGYQVFVVADAVSSRQRDSYETALQRLRQAGIILCDTESVLYEWFRGTQHEHFAPVQTLLKQRQL